MAESLDDGEFWLPPKFLNDDDVFADEKCGGYNVKSGKTGVSLYPFEFPLGFGPVGGVSDLGSPVESSETESDEDEYIAGLTRQMARSTFEDGFTLENSNGWGISGSPQSTLCGCGCKQISSRGSPNGHSDASFPQMTLDLLYAAAGEVTKLRMNNEAYASNNCRGLKNPLRRPTPVTIPARNSDPEVGAYQQLQASQFLHLRRRQQLIEQLSSAARVRQMKGSGRHPQPGPQMPQNRGRNSEFFNGRNCRPTGLTSPPTWAPQKQSMNHQNGSGMRAVFLGNPGAKRECAGTGVFLPRNVGTLSDTRKKPACSTVLVPARVMQALNLNLDEMCVPPQLHSRPLPPPPFTAGKNDSSLRPRSDGFASHQMVSHRPPAALNHDVRLPPEWTY